MGDKANNAHCVLFLRIRQIVNQNLAREHFIVHFRLTYVVLHPEEVSNGEIADKVLEHYCVLHSAFDLSDFL